MAKLVLYTHLVRVFAPYIACLQFIDRMSPFSKFFVSTFKESAQKYEQKVVFIQTNFDF